MRMGVSLSRRIERATSNPSTPASPRSSTTSAGFRRAKSASARPPSGDTWHSYPEASRFFTMRLAIRESSSTTRIFWLMHAPPIPLSGQPLYPLARGRNVTPQWRVRDSWARAQLPAICQPGAKSLPHPPGTVRHVKRGGDRHPDPERNMQEGSLMARAGVIGIAAGIAVLAALAIGVVQTRADKTPADLTGTWRLDASRSDLPGTPRNSGEGRFGPGRGSRDGGGAMEGRRRGGDGEGRRRGGDGFRRRGPALPAVFHVTQKAGVVGFADSTGALFQEIFVGSAPPNGKAPNRNEDVRRAAGRWSDGTLEVEREGRRGGTMVQKFKLDDDGRTLEVRMERKGGSEGREGRSGRSGGFKMVYRRVV